MEGEEKGKRNGEEVDRHMTGAGEVDHNYVEWTERRIGEAKNRQGGDRCGPLTLLLPWLIIMQSLRRNGTRVPTMSSVHALAHAY